MRFNFRSVLALPLAMLLPAQAATIRLLMNDQPSPPYLNGGADNPAPLSRPGTAILAIRKAMQQCRQTVRFMPRPTPRMLQEAALGQAEGALMISWSPERNAIFRYPSQDGIIDPSRALARLDYVFYVRPDARLRWNGQKLEGQTRPVGTLPGWSINNDLARLGIPAENGRDTDQLFAALSSRRIDAFAIHDTIGDAWQRAHPAFRFRKLSPPISSKDYYLVFTHRFADSHPDTTRCIWQALPGVRSAAGEH